MIVTGPAQTIDRARDLRATMSLPEVRLWKQLRGSPDGMRFRRQHPAGPYILDFFCAKARLVVEIDGIVHSMGSAALHDARRDIFLSSLGLHVWRVSAAEVLLDVERVAASIIALARARHPLHHATPHGPPPRSGEDFRTEATPWTI